MRLAFEFEVPSWDQIYDMLLGLADKIKQDRYRPDIIVGISRGGWPPARIMSDLLGNPELANVKVEFYEGVGKTREVPVITQPISVPVKESRVLLMDDVADTGRSLKLVKERAVKCGAREVRTATIYYKPWSIIKPDYYMMETRKWIVFPWERKETVKQLLRECREKCLPIDVLKQELLKGGMKPELLERLLRDVIEEEQFGGSEIL
ncbi:MAG: phosphoribosyltransferase [Nitrososphaerota archaeon]|nr:phosphoribosyltransferase [Candidatus Bathyarchaeota archaeon]MDW8048996.1 phosphoribosyltransferase [Nitrososphaerota archaeon]